MSEYVTDEVVEKAAKVGFAAAAANAAKKYGLGQPVTWDGDLTDWDRAHELRRLRAALEAAAPLIAEQALRDALARLGRAAYAVDSTHHFHGIQCSCGFTGDARKRTQTEHITTAVLEAYNHD